MDENASEPEGAETITDIQNYLASFNKEIQDGGTAGASTNATALESTAESAAAEGNTETAFFVAAPGTATGEGFQFEQAEVWINIDLLLNFIFLLNLEFITYLS